MHLHPWRVLRDELPQWEVVWEELPPEVLGLTDYNRREIVLDRRHLQGQRRASLLHEIWHIRRGDTDPDQCDTKVERWIERQVARDLIPIDHLVKAAEWAANLHELADELWVDEALVVTRVQNLHPAERAAVTLAVRGRDRNCPVRCAGCTVC